MKRTRAATLVLWALAPAVAVWILENVLVSCGQTAVVAPFTMGPALAVLSVVLLLMAWQVRQAARGKRRIDHGFALGVVSFAKAASIIGSLLLGASLGALAFFASRAVVAADATLSLGLLAGGSALLIAAGLVAEHWCVLPPDDEAPSAPAASAAPTPSAG